MSVYRSAQGRQIDMAQIVAKNEKVRAVGNKNVNARGDTIDSQNRIITDVTRSVKNNYNNTVSKKETIAPDPTPAPKPRAPAKPPVQEMSKDEMMFEDDDISDEELAELKKPEKTNGSKKTSV